MTPTTYCASATLSSGLRVAVRPLHPEDRMDLIAGFEHLSAESRYRRFMSSKSRLSQAEVDRLLDPEHIALVLVWPRTSSRDVVLGIAQALAEPGRPGTAEFCIVVADEIHGCGGGRLLTTHLAREARERGLQYLSGYMLASNEAPARLLAGTGEVVHDRFTCGTREMTVRL